MTKSKKPKILFYDIETAPLQAWIWRCGKQVVRHNQLVEGRDSYDIICIAYEWLHSRERGILHWDYKKQDSSKMIEEFTKISDQADMIIGKNNKRFDDKHVNTMRLVHGLQGRPDLLSKVDDLETQVRKHFAFASNSLDYISHLIGLGGKNPVGFDDWINIVTKNKDGEKSFKKMLKYCQKDVTDTKKIWKYCESHMQPRYNHSAVALDMVCKVCGSKNIKRNGFYTAVTGVTYQQFLCKDHNGYAGKISINAKKPILRS